MIQSESHIQRAVLAAWGAHPRLRLVRTNTGAGWFSKGKPARKTDPGAYPVKFGVPGTADLCGIIAPSGRLIAVEIKTPTGVQSPEQKIFQRVVTEFGGLYVLARSVDDLDKALAKLGITR